MASRLCSRCRRAVGAVPYLIHFLCSECWDWICEEHERHRGAEADASLGIGPADYYDVKRKDPPDSSTVDEMVEDIRRMSEPPEL